VESKETRKATVVVKEPGDGGFSVAETPKGILCTHAKKRLFPNGTSCLVSYDDDKGRVETAGRGKWRDAQQLQADLPNGLPKIGSERRPE
jgi:hypothetical protein